MRDAGGKKRFDTSGQRRIPERPAAPCARTQHYACTRHSRRVRPV
jgi:hypothetical protein